LLNLPSCILVAICEYLEWSDWESIGAILKGGPLVAALQEAFAHICLNTWTVLAEPQMTFDVGRIRSSMLSSVDRLRKGEMSAKVQGADLNLLRGSNSGEPRLKMMKLEGMAVHGGREAAVAKVIALMYQTLSTAVEGSAKMLTAVEEALRTGAQGTVAAKIARLELLQSGAKKALKRYRKKVVIPASHLQEIRVFEEKITQQQKLVELYKKNHVGSPPPVGLVLTRHQFGAILRPTQTQLHIHGQLLSSPSAPIQSVSSCRVKCMEQDTLLDILANNEAAFEQEIVQFDQVKFTKPTRQKLCRLHLEATVTCVDGRKVEVQSDETHPILVYSHQKQLGKKNIFFLVSLSCLFLSLTHVFK
jgi:hypothetical protein